MSDIRITAIKALGVDKRPNGSRLLASFDCEARGVYLNGLGLLRKAGGDFQLTVPRDRADRPLMGFSDPDLAALIAAAAKRALAALT